MFKTVKRLGKRYGVAGFVFKHLRSALDVRDILNKWNAIIESRRHTDRRKRPITEQVREKGG